MEPLSQDKNAVVYGVVARVSAREGVKVSSAGRTLAKLDGVAREVRAAGVYRAWAS